MEHMASSCLLNPSWSLCCFRNHFLLKICFHLYAKILILFQIVNSFLGSISSEISQKLFLYPEIVLLNEYIMPSSYKSTRVTWEPQHLIFTCCNRSLLSPCYINKRYPLCCIFFWKMQGLIILHFTNHS